MDNRAYHTWKLRIIENNIGTNNWYSFNKVIISFFDVDIGSVVVASRYTHIK